MRQLEDMDFPIETAERIITTTNADSDSFQDIKDLIYFTNGLGTDEVLELVEEIQNQLGA